MKYKGSIDINQPLAIVTALFADSKNLVKYQDGFQKKELIKGTEGQDGTVSKLYYKSDKHEMELTETIIANRLPHTFEAFYHHKHMDNTMKTTFTALSDEQTRYETEVEYTRINWVMPKLIAILFPSMYRKPGERWMKNFKTLAEQQ
ncbi:hypothetical protein AWE51_03610 [Aquimarina aggregata]|uniref:SRPBCC family protein n=1 Tax=Aquimarina aggregata TaxID=1642818 RepID=A0A163CLL4_9FLAO|nr:SRPBCC family protein [Aquimarina aggregata]KZS42541.1 hypothetical protein AWE51_03610 [Aquimarina aggregata]